MPRALVAGSLTAIVQAPVGTGAGWIKDEKKKSGPAWKPATGARGHICAFSPAAKLGRKREGPQRQRQLRQRLEWWGPADSRKCAPGVRDRTREGYQGKP